MNIPVRSTPLGARFSSFVELSVLLFRTPASAAAKTVCMRQGIASGCGTVVWGRARDYGRLQSLLQWHVLRFGE